MNSIEYYAGFVEYVEVNAEQLAQAARVFAIARCCHRTRTCRSKKLHGTLDSLLGLPRSFLNALVTLDVRKNQLDDAEAIRIVTSPELSSVVVLDLARNPITEATLRAIRFVAALCRDQARTGSSAELVDAERR